MAFGFVAFHDPAPEHVEEFVGRCHQIADVSRRQPGFLSVEVWVTPDGGAIVTPARSSPRISSGRWPTPPASWARRPTA